MANRYRGRERTTPEFKIASINYHTVSCPGHKPCKIADNHVSQWTGRVQVYDKDFGSKPLGKVILYLHGKITFKELMDPTVFACHVCNRGNCFELTHLYADDAEGNIGYSVESHRRPLIFVRSQFAFIYESYFIKKDKPFTIQQNSFLRYRIRGDNSPLKRQEPSIGTVINVILNNTKSIRGFRRRWMLANGVVDPYRIVE